MAWKEISKLAVSLGKGRVGEEAVCAGVIWGAHTGLKLWQVQTQDRLEPGFRAGAMPTGSQALVPEGRGREMCAFNKECPSHRPLHPPGRTWQSL